MVNVRWLTAFAQWIVIVLVFALSSCSMPKEKIELRQIKDVIADANSEPMLKATAVFYNPNNTRARLKKIDVEIFINGKKVGKVDQDLKLVIPARDEFFVNLEVKLALKELGFMDTLFGMLGGKKFQIEYKGFLKLTYHGLPIRVPVAYKDEIRVKF
jgi:LEA14-like dessication related protein